ncbi:MAG: class II glutamine amidotransferase [Polyangiales bacterium]
MCELFAISAASPTRVHYSLEEFSKHGGLTHMNKSGWGISYYHERDASVFKEAAPASDSELVRFIANQELMSQCVVAHVRRASVGADSPENTHPFDRELAGRTHVFAHNGSLPGIEFALPLEGSRFVPMGQTDSEHAFCVLLDRLTTLWSAETLPPLAPRLSLIVEFASALRSIGTANFLYFDGDTLFAHAHKRAYDDGGVLSEPRAPGLNIASRATIVTGGLRVTAPDSDPEGVMLASVPLSAEGWSPLREGSVVAIRAGNVVAEVPADS